jgi:hypothetical protein
VAPEKLYQRDGMRRTDNHHVVLKVKFARARREDGRNEHPKLGAGSKLVGPELGSEPI